MTIGQRIKERRIALGYTVEDVAKLLGKNRATVYRYENGYIEDLPTAVLESLAKALDTTPADLMGWKDEPLQENTTIKVLGRVAAGLPVLEADENVIDTEEISPKLARSGEYFGLRVQGDSMMPDIQDGDTVIVRKQNDAETDEIVIALIDGNDGVCKKLKKYNDGIALISLNPQYEPMYFREDDIDRIPVSIIGKVVELRRKM